MNTAGDRDGVRLIEAGCVADANGAFAPGGLLVRTGADGPEVVAAGPLARVRGHEAAASAAAVDRRRHLVLPAMVNAHTHLDLTHVGPRPYTRDEGFLAWLAMVIKGRRTDDAGIGESVRDGIKRSVRGGVAAVGDIAGGDSLVPLRALRASELMGVSYLEFLGRGRAEARAVDRIRGLAARGSMWEQGVCFGISPHAPYSAGPSVMRAAAEVQRDAGVPMCTHLAESPEEREFVGVGTGPFKELLDLLGVRDEWAVADVGRGRTPIEHMRAALSIAPVLAAHVNDCSDSDLETLARTRTRVVYCPRSSAYFGQGETFGPHRYWEMLQAGIDVCLGTDSIINIPEEEADRLSIWDEMRFLWRRDRADVRTLVAMATVHGARALGLEEDAFTFGGGRVAGVIGIEVDRTVRGDWVEAALETGGRVEWIAPARGAA